MTDRSWSVIRACTNFELLDRGMGCQGPSEVREIGVQRIRSRAVIHQEADGAHEVPEVVAFLFGVQPRTVNIRYGVAESEEYPDTGPAEQGLRQDCRLVFAFE